MSYLPRMSKTYKEPQKLELEEFKPSISNLTRQPASCLLNEKTQNPQTILKHYKYLPHSPPVLPGPSVAEEAKENELYREASKQRSSSKILDFSKPSQNQIVSETSFEVSDNLTKDDFMGECIKSIKPFHSKKNIKKSEFNIEEKKVNNSKKSFAGSKTDIKYQNKNEKTKSKDGNLKIKATEYVHRYVQCAVFLSAEKIFVITPIIHSLLQTLAFLLREINREKVIEDCSSGKRKGLMTQIQLILGDLCNQKVEKNVSFNTTYSDFKRIEKIHQDLQNCLKNIYGDKGEYINRMEDMKKIFIDLKKKEMKVTILNEKLLEKKRLETEKLDIKESDFKIPEITLQNKRLESEQLLAEIEFSSQELRNNQKTIAEIEWDIKIFQDQVASLKKYLLSRSKTVILQKNH